MPAIDATPMIRPLSWTRPWASSSVVIRSGATRLTSMTELQRSSSMLASVLSRVMPALCTTMSTPPWAVVRWCAIRFGASLRGDVEREVVAAELLGQRDQVARGLWHVDADDGGAVAGEHPRDLLADPAGGAGDERDLAGERTLPVGLLGGLRGRRADPDHLPGDVRRLRRQQEAQRRRGRALGPVGDVDQLGGAAAADLLAEAAREALEGALGDPLLARDLLRWSAEDDQPGAALEAPHQRREEVAQREQLRSGP